MTYPYVIRTNACIHRPGGTKECTKACPWYVDSLEREIATLKQTLDRLAPQWKFETKLERLLYRVGVVSSNTEAPDPITRARRSLDDATYEEWRDANVEYEKRLEEVKTGKAKTKTLAQVDAARKAKKTQAKKKPVKKAPVKKKTSKK